jgi:acyl carrier protein
MGDQRQMQASGDIERDIKTFLNTNFPLYDEEKVDREQSLVESGVIDSLGILELVEFIEETYELRIPEDELLPENLDSLANVTRYLTGKVEPESIVKDQSSGA